MDDADKATDLEEARTASLMAKIAKELSAVNDNIYCEDCESEIPAARRRAMPNATRCIRCQESHDRLFKGVKRF